MTTQTASQHIHFGHSPDPDDAFMFYAFAYEKIPMRGFKVEHVIWFVTFLVRFVILFSFRLRRKKKPLDDFAPLNAARATLALKSSGNFLRIWDSIFTARLYIPDAV